jgi:hypothetical protein
MNGGPDYCAVNIELYKHHYGRSVEAADARPFFGLVDRSLTAVKKRVAFSLFVLRFCNTHYKTSRVARPLSESGATLAEVVARSYCFESRQPREDEHCHKKKRQWNETSKDRA